MCHFRYLGNTLFLRHKRNNNNNNNNKGYLSTPHLKRAQGVLQDNNTMVKTTDQDKIFTT